MKCNHDLPKGMNCEICFPYNSEINIHIDKNKTYKTESGWYCKHCDENHQEGQTCSYKLENKYVCDENWRELINKYRDSIGKKFIDEFDNIYIFFGLVYGEDDYYYGLWNESNKVLNLISCVEELRILGYKEYMKPKYRLCWLCNRKFRNDYFIVKQIDGHERHIHKSCADEYEYNKKLNSDDLGRLKIK